MRTCLHLSWLLEEVLSSRLFSFLFVLGCRGDFQAPQMQNQEPPYLFYYLILRKKNHGLVCKLYNGKIEFSML